MTGAMGLRCEALRVTVARGVQPLKGVSVQVGKGQITAVIGPSGVGKTTLLNVVSGLLRPDSGTVQLDGVDVTALPPERRRLGMVFQDLRLFPFLSGRDNVAFGPRVAGLPAAEARRRVDQALHLTRATAFAHRSVRVLSGGERQRIAIARALAMTPGGLLLDEPFGGLDAELRRGLRDELRALIAELRLTTLLVTHDRDDAFALASRILVLRQGEVEQEGEATECYEAPRTAFVATLLGEAAILPITERRGDRALVCGAWIEVRGGGGSAVLRPEKLRLAEEGAQTSFQATLLDARFAAGHWRLLLQLAGVAGPVVALSDRPPAGSQVWLAVRGVVPTV